MNQKTLERKEQSKQNAKQWAMNEELPVLKSSVKQFTKIDGNTTSYSMNGIKANARKLVEQDVNIGLKNKKLKILGQPYDEVLKMRKNFGETGGVKYYQNLIPEQLVNKVLRSQHGEFGKHTGNSKTIIAYREEIIFQKWRN